MTLLLGRTDRHTRNKSLSENDEEGLAIEKDEYTSSTSTSSSVSTSSSCYDENEHICGTRCWRSSVTCRLACGMATPVDEVAHSQSCTLMPFLHSTLYVTRVAVVDFLRSGCRGRSPSLTHLWLHNLYLRRPFRLTNSLAHSWYCTGGNKVTLSLSVCVVRPCRKAVSTEGMQTSTTSTLVSLKHHSLPLHLTSDDTNHGQFRREQHLAGDWQRHPANAFHT